MTLRRTVSAIPPHRSARWSHAAAWVAATVAGEVLGAAAILGLVLVAGDLDPGQRPVAWGVLAAAAGALYGSLVGLAQWVVIRRLEPRARLWTLAGVVSWLLAGVLFAALERSLCVRGSGCAGTDWYGVLLEAGIVALTSGAMLSALLQWLLLRPLAARAAWWLALLPAAMLPWLLGELAGLGVFAWFLLQPALSAVLLVLLFGRGRG